jgi:hypothetical protein
MLTDEVVAVSEESVKITSLVVAFGLIAASTACVSEQAVAPEAAANPVAMRVASSANQVPLLFIVDGIRYPKDQVPTLSADRVSAVKVLKGTAALRLYGQDAAYGAVIITTKSANIQGS